MSHPFWEIVRFEVRFRLRQPATYLFFAILFALACVVMSSDVGLLSDRDEHAFLNAPFLIALLGTLLMAFGSIMICAIAGTAIYRDFETNIHDLFFTTSLTKRDYFFGRFWGAFLVSLLVYAAIPLGLICGTFAPWANHDNFGPFRLDTYLALFFDFLLPDLFLLSVLFFVWGALTRSLLVIYTQGIVLLVCWLISVALLNGLNNRDLSGLLEPFGVRAGSEITRYWTLIEQDHRLMPMTGLLLENRLLWSGIALTFLIGGYFLFDLSHSPLTRRQRQITPSPPAVFHPVPATEGTAPAPTGLYYWLTVYRRLTGFYTSEILRGIPFLLITLSGILLLTVTCSQADKIYDTPVYPVTHIILDSIVESFGLFHIILISFYAGELIWRERVLRADQMMDALPTPTSITLLSKVTAVLLMSLGLNTVLILTGITIQVAKGYYHFELPLYFARLFGISPPGLLCVIFLAFFMHTVINHKFLSHTAIGLVFLASSALEQFGWDRHLYRFATGPEIVYSDMNGFGPFLNPTLCWQYYWLSFSTLLLLLALRLWVRGTEERMPTRWRKGRFGSMAWGITAIATLLFVGLGGFTIYNTDVLHTYRSEKAARHIVADYERHFKATWENRPMPRITGVTLDVTLYPERLQYRLRGIYRLKNKTTQPIRQVAVDYDASLHINLLQFGIGARPDIIDRANGFRTFTLNHPLLPGAETTFTFDLAYRKRGFPNDHLVTKIAGNGTFLTLPAPRIGYQPESELDDTKDRRYEDLPERRAMPPVTDRAARYNTYVGNDADWIDFAATVRTAPDQIALAPGYLTKTWNEKGRRCFHYKMDAPIRNFYSILSAHYAVKRDTWTDSKGKKVALEIYYHPTHLYNLDHMMRGMKASLTYCSRNYAPYQFRQLRIVEFPAYISLAQSFPNTIPYSESIGFIARVHNGAEDIDYPFYVTAHETAHQWWAHQVLGANVEGSEVLSESLAEYSALMVLQQNYGREYTHRFLRYDMDQYLTGRSGDSGNENPLVAAQHQQYLHYNKGALVFYALAERMGPERLNAILSRFLHDKRFQEPPYTTARELVAYLKQGATPDKRAFITDLFEKITLYECKTETATARKRKNGKWRVTMTVSVKKVYADKDGSESPAPLHDRFPIGIFARPSQSEQENHLTGKPLKISSINLISNGMHGTNKETLTLIYDVDSVPYQAGIDPYNTLIDRHPDNNVVSIVEK